MRIRSLVLVVALCGLAVPALAQQATLTSSTSTGCDTYLPYAWTTLTPGAKWETTVNLLNCGSADLGWFRFYGWITKGRNNDTLRGQDGIVLTVTNLATGQSVTCDASGKTEEYLMVDETQPAQIRLTAVNTSKQNAKISLTWLSMTQ